MNIHDDKTMGFVLTSKRIFYICFCLYSCSSIWNLHSTLKLECYMWMGLFSINISKCFKWRNSQRHNLIHITPSPKCFRRTQLMLYHLKVICVCLIWLLLLNVCVCRVVGIILILTFASNYALSGGNWMCEFLIVICNCQVRNIYFSCYVVVAGGLN